MTVDTRQVKGEKVLMSQRSNLWCFVGYPGDSLPIDYLTIINNWHIPVAISPIHNKDKNGDLTEKKKHIHFMIYFGNGANKSFDQVKKYTNQLNATIPIIVESRNAMIRYFIHKDNPEKQQGIFDNNKYIRDWSRSDIICLNGFEIGDAFESYSNDNLIYDKIEEVIKDNNIINFKVLVDSLKYYNMKVELNYLRRHTIYFKELINANYQLIKKDIKID